MTKTKEEYPLIFSFRGAALKAELFLGITMLIIMVISTVLIVYMQLLFNPEMKAVDIPFVRCILAGAGVSIFLGRFLGKFASQEWKIIINEEQITISNEAKKYHIPFNKTQITYCGENGFRILKFSSDIVVRLTVGTHFYTPFSTKKILKQ